MFRAQYSINEEHLIQVWHDIHDSVQRVSNSIFFVSVTPLIFWIKNPVWDKTTTGLRTLKSYSDHCYKATLTLTVQSIVVASSQLLILFTPSEEHYMQLREYTHVSCTCPCLVIILNIGQLEFKLIIMGEVMVKAWRHYTQQDGC